MKYVISAMLGMLFIASAASAQTGADEAHYLNGLDVAFVYYGTSGEDVPWDNLANFYADYRSASNEFEKRDLLVQYRTAMQSVTDAGRYSFLTESYLEEYDFENEEYELDLVDGSMFPINIPNMRGENFGIRFLNMDNVRKWSIPANEAREVAEKAGGRHVLLSFHFEPVAAKLSAYGNRMYRMVDVNVVKVRVLNSSRELVGAFSPEAVAYVAEVPAPAPEPEREMTADERMQELLDRTSGAGSLWRIRAETQRQAEERLRANVEEAGECIERYGFSECERRLGGRP